MSSQPQYKLTYFNIRGKGELVRLVFVAAGVAFEDDRVEFENWPSMKQDAPFGQLPLLLIDNEIQLSQTLCISRYLANKHGLAGKTDLEKIQADIVSDCVEDVLNCILKYHQQKDENQKIELQNKFKDEHLPAYLSYFERMLKKNNGGDGFFVGSSLTWADLSVYQCFNSYIRLAKLDPPLNLNNFPKLDALLKRVENDEKVSAYLATRQDTEF